MANKKKNKKWVKPRHAIIRKLVWFVFYPFVRFKYHAKITKFKCEKGKQYLILINHQTAFDQFFVGLSFSCPVYYLASEDLFSKGFVSTLLRWAVAPIPIKKQATDIRAVMNCVKVVREGGTIALSPEGNRTFSGKTEYIKPAIAGLIKTLKLPVVFFRIEGGYGVEPRWSGKVRKGNMRAYPSKVMPYEEYKDMSDEQLLQIVKSELYVNEGVADAEFKNKNLAQYLERAMYVCPKCGLSEFKSDKDIISCKKCGLKIRYLPNKKLKCENGEIPFEFTTEWYDYQSDFINSFNPLEHTETPLYVDKTNLSEVILYKNKKKIENDVTAKLFGNRIEIVGNKTNLTLNFDDLNAVVVLGRNKVNLYLSSGKLLQFKSDKRFNALKYVQIYYRYKNIKKGEPDVKFLGL